MMIPWQRYMGARGQKDHKYEDTHLKIDVV